MPLLRFVRAILLTAATMLPHHALSDVLILTPDSDYARNAAEKLKSHIQKPSRIVHSLESDTNTDLVVALGRESFLDASAHAAVPVIGTFLSPVDQGPISSKAPRYRIFSDPSPKKMAEFLKAKFPNSIVGFIHTDEEALFVQEMREILKNSSTRLESVRFSGNTFSDIRNLSRKSINVMLVSKNRDIYHPERVRFVLEALFRKKMPVISMSASLVPAGATVSVSPSVEAVIKTTSSYVNELIKNKLSSSSQAVYVEEVTIEVNPAMSEYFNFDFGDKVQ